MLKKIVMTAALAGSALGATNAELDSRIEALEYAGYENWWSMTGSLEYRYDGTEVEHKKAYSSTSFSGTSTENAAGDISEVVHHRLFSQIDLMAKPSKKLTFYGRLSASKGMNNFNKGGGNYAADSTFNEMYEGTAAGNSAVFFERAFVNYNITNELVFSVGRLPTIDGAPKHFANASSPMGGYPALAFGGIFDGMALTYGAKVAGGTLTLRGIYTPFNQRDVAATTSKIEDSNGLSVDENVDVYSAMIEYNKAGLSWANSINATYQYLAFDGMKAIAKSTAFVRGPSTVGNKVISVVTDGDTTLGLKRHVLNLEVNGLAKTGLNLGLSYLKGETKSTGEITQSKILADGTDLGTTSLGTWLGEEASTKDGNAFIVNASYTLKMFNGATFGGEYVDIDEDAFVYDIAAKDLTGQYTAMGGSSKHFYWVQPIDSNFKITVGYQTSQRKRTYALAGYIGEASDIDTERKAYYTSMQFNF